MKVEMGATGSAASGRRQPPARSAAGAPQQIAEGSLRRAAHERQDKDEGACKDIVFLTRSLSYN